MDRTGDEIAVEVAFTHGPAAMQADIGQGMERIADTKEGDWVAGHDDDLGGSRRELVHLRDPHELLHEQQDLARRLEPFRHLYRNGPAWSGGEPMTREEKAKFVAQAKEVILALGRLEVSIASLGGRLAKAEQKEAFDEIFAWLGSTSDLSPDSYTREWARELLGHIGVLATYDKYEGTTDGYIA